MTRPAWLPPLNSHENYSINVGIHQFNVFPTPTRPPKGLNSMGILICAFVNFYSDNVDNDEDDSYFDGLSLGTLAKNGCVELPPSEVKLRNYVKQLLRDREIVPFKLDKIECYRETDELEPMLDQSYDNQLRSQNDLVNHITDFLFRTICQYSQMGGQNLSITLMIEKLVKIPDQEFKAWTSWYEEQKRANPDGFEAEYKKAISVPRTEYELWYESSMLAYESAAESCVESLEKLVLEEAVDCEQTSCTICLEEIDKGEEVTKLPCSHVYHAHCVVQWLKTTPFLPNMPYSILPTLLRNS
ncbi:hypothetical protein F511_26953 [Dorcoceras hygrometricum]|uniref:RING-type domain-containing protein n=1 Tax=Dorcoceras hygrometricum TaxID=472368 RepID=A0A2Z7AHR0_9LAMI|nr:hypothetical protein F511_26953 [Dorcoceras hygrometricum]